MPKLVVNVGHMPSGRERGPLEVACSLQDRIRFADHIGEDVFVAARSGSGDLMIRAIATLERFASSGTSSSAVLVNMRALPVEKKVAEGPEKAVFSLWEDAEMDFTQTNTSLPYPGLDEAATAFVSLDIYGEIARQVREDRDSRCSFSGVEVSIGEGTATPIVPLDSGGKVHARNFIFLHDEPAQLFTQFGWTIGPDLEIIADAWATGTSVLSTINSTGKLLVGEDQRQWPDERALAWHRQQFLDRLR